MPAFPASTHLLPHPPPSLLWAQPKPSPHSFNCRPRDCGPLQISQVIDQAVFAYVPWTFNYYHAFAEGLVGMHIRACQSFGYCNASHSSPQHPPRMFRIEAKDAHVVWSQRLPGLHRVTQCVTPQGVLHINDSSLWEQVGGCVVIVVPMGDHFLSTWGTYIKNF